MSRNDAALIAIDWGTSNLRAALLDAEGRTLEARSAPGGVMAVPERRFAEALQPLVADWLDARRVPLVASGMVGSRQGWQEAPYLPCPARLADAARQLTRVALPNGGMLHIAPGLTCTAAHGHADVMRGEETQLWGAGLAAGRCCVLPGTHSKWAWMGGDGAIDRFATSMTGELYGLLTKHSILGRLMRLPGEASPAAFEQGVRIGLAQHARLLHAVFAARTAGLMGELAPEALPDFLSGLLIGGEIGGMQSLHAQREVALLGDDDLCARYAAALAVAGIASTRAAEGATTRGQWRLAQAAGLLERTA